MRSDALQASSGGGLLRLTAPLHPLLVHFTVALTISAYLLDIAALFSGAASLRSTGWWTLLSALLVTPVTVATGVRARVRLPLEEGEARAFLRTHMALGPIVLGLLLVIGIWRGQLWGRGATVTWPYLAAMSVVVLVVIVQGYLGGELVYRYGAEVRSRYRQLPETGAADRRSAQRLP
jgi:uncharacterized membrane protein